MVELNTIHCQEFEPEPWMHRVVAALEALASGRPEEPDARWLASQLNRAREEALAAPERWSFRLLALHLLFRAAIDGHRQSAAFAAGWCRRMLLGERFNIERLQRDAWTPALRVAVAVFLHEAPDVLAPTNPTLGGAR